MPGFKSRNTISGGNEKMRKLIFLFAIILLFPCINYTMFEQREPGARITSMGGAGVAFTEDIYAPYINPAGLIFMNDISALFTYYSLFPSLEGLEPISYLSISGGIPVPKFGTLSLGYNSFGFEDYKETTLLFSPAFELFYRMGLGFNLKLYSVSIKDAGDASSVGIDIGIIAKIYQGFSIGGFVYNVNSPTIGESNDELSQYGTVGIEFVPANGLSLNFDIQKVVDRKINLRVGQEFRLARYFFIRSGVQSNPTKYALGLGLHYQYITFDYALSVHNTLGSQHIITLKFSLGEETKTLYTEKVPRRAKAAPAAVPEVEYVGPKININTATLDELTQLPRVGPKTAEKIIKYREEHGPFKTIEDIMNVKGIGPKTFAKMRHMITVGEVGKPEKKEVPAEIQPMAFDLNKAQMKDFIEKGIPPIIGLRIIQYREKKGVIKSVDELKNIEGMTPEIFEKLKKLVEGK